MRAECEKPALGVAPLGGLTGDLCDEIPPLVTRKVDRASRLKLGALSMAECIAHFGPRVEVAAGLPSGHSQWLSGRVGGCSSWLMLREHQDKVRVGAMNSCKAHLVCSCCAAARSRRLVHDYLQRLSTVISGNGCTPYLLTLTIPSTSARYAVGGDECGTHRAVSAECDALRAGIGLCLDSWRKLWARRKVRGNGALWQVQGAVVALEVTHGEAGWHPHLHALVLLPLGQIVDVVQLRREWHELTGGVQIRIDRVTKGLCGLVEVLKYTSKPAELVKGQTSVEGAYWRFLAYSVLRGRRAVFGYGSLFGIPDPEDFEEDWDGDPAEAREWWFRWQSAARRYRRVSGYLEATFQLGDR